MFELIARLLQAPLSLVIECEVPSSLSKVHAESVQGWDARVRMAAIDVADNIAAVFGDKSAAVGAAAEETVMTDNQTVRGGRCSEHQGELSAAVDNRGLRQRFRFTLLSAIKSAGTGMEYSSVVIP
ncbi:hypothetical protein V501_07540 [Pseudogymnoascus sp. VKM F-4519 (FW-2642)]|nr:hypothetical protein V501_07540 [Pseudogymnoascus sp. VKM F-4519 (FW-2642)]